MGRAHKSTHALSSAKTHKTIENTDVSECAMPDSIAAVHDQRGF
jgi:hypothetical protein